MTIPAFVKKLCCCEGEYSDDEQALIDDEDVDEANILSSRGVISRDSLTNVWIPGSGNNSMNGTPATSRVQADNEEEQMLKQIIDATRQNIVCIGNTNELAPNNEEIARAKRYQEMVKQHDARLLKQHHLNSTNDSSALRDVGERVIEVLSAEPLTSENQSFIATATKQLSDAVAAGMQIEHKQEIIVHMPLDDDVIIEE